MYLADKASSEGEGIWCSKYTIARETELSLASVKRVIREFVREQILVETGIRSCDRGYTVVYSISIAAVKRLPKLKKEPEEHTGSSENRVLTAPPTGCPQSCVPGSARPTNLSSTNLKTSLPEQVLAELWASYPNDRTRRFEQCKDIVARLLAEGTAADEIVEGAKAYTAATIGYERNRVFFLDNWLRKRQWAEYSQTASANKLLEELNASKVAAQHAEWIIGRSLMCNHISAAQATEAIKRGLVTEDQVRLAGVPR